MQAGGVAQLVLWSWPKQKRTSACCSPFFLWRRCLQLLRNACANQKKSAKPSTHGLRRSGWPWL